MCDDDAFHIHFVIVENKSQKGHKLVELRVIKLVVYYIDCNILH